MKGRIFAVAAAIAVMAVAAPAAATAAPAPATAGVVSEGVPHFGHVFVIIGENTKLTQVTKKHMPYWSGSSSRMPPG